MDIELHMAARILVAAALGAVVGAEREAADQPAGLRTHLTVAIGAALFGVISTLGFEEFRAGQRDVNIQFDVTRVASTVVTGVGFLGAGMILRRGSTVHHLTTAASIWVVAAIGLACGVGDLGPALVATVALLAGLIVLRLPRTWIRRYLAHEQESVRVVLAPGAPTEPLEAALAAIDGLEVRQLALEKRDGAYILVADLRADPPEGIRGRLTGVARRDDVVTLQIGAGG